MTSSVRINVRVAMGNAVAQFARMTAQMKALEAAAARSNTGMARFGAGVATSFQNMELASKRLGQSGRILLFNFTLPLTLGFTKLTQELLKTDKAAAQLSQVYESASGSAKQFGVANQEVDQDLQSLGKVALALSNGFGVARSEVMDLMVVFGRAGAKSVQLARYTELALTVMQAFGTTSKEASDAILTAATSYQLVGNQVNVAMAQLGFAANKTRADVATLSAGFVKAAPTAQQLGIDIATLTSWLAVMQQAGFKGAEAGTALNFGFTRLVKSTPEAIDLFKKIGLNIEEASFAAADGSKRIQMVTEALGGLTGAQRAYGIAIMFGVRQQPKFTALLADMLRTGGLYNEIMAEMTDSTKLLAYMDNQLLLSMDNLDTKFKILKTEIVNNMMAVAVMLAPALLALLQIITNLTRKFAELGNTAGGRQKQMYIVLGAMALAAAGPLVILISTLGVLIGILGSVASAAFGLAAFFVSPIGIIVAAFTGLLVFSARFRDAFINVFAGLYRAIVKIAMMIYEALQWMNPFARHSPSLVEQTRDGVAQMVGYWGNMKPVLSLMDAQAAQVRKFGDVMRNLGLSTEAAADAQARMDIAKAGGGGALAEYDKLISLNAELGRAMLKIDAQYGKQADKVETQRKAMEASNDEIKRSEKNLKALRSESDRLSKQLEDMGDPQALKSQATAASNMARVLAEGGNMDLAAQFAEQATAMDEQAKNAAGVKQQLDSVATAIDNEEAALDRLREQHELIAQGYDLEREKLDSLEQGFRAVEQAIQDNNAAMKDAASQASTMIAEMERAAKAAEDAAKAGGAGGGGKDPFAQFDAAGTADLPDMVGGAAVPGNLPPDTGDTMEGYLTDLQARMKDRMSALFPNPFGVIKEWGQKFSDAWSAITGAFDLGGGGGVSMAGWAQPIGDAIDRAKTKFAELREAAEPMFEKLRLGWEGIKTGIDNLLGALAGPLEAMRGALAGAFGVVIDIFTDIAEVSGKAVMRIFSEIGDFWATNGPAIGTIVGVIAGFFLDWYRLLLDIATWVVEKLWPVFKFGLEGIWQIIEGLVKVFSGFFQMIVQALTGDFSSAWEGFKKMLSGLGDIAMGLGKVLIAAIVGFAVWIVGTGLGLVWGALVGLVPMVGKLALQVVEALGKGLWALIKLTDDLVLLIFQGFVKLGELLGPWIAKIPGLLWDGLKAAWNGVWKFAEFMSEKIAEWSTVIFAKIGEFGGGIPGKLWDGLKAAWEAAVTFSNFVTTKITEWSAVAFEKMMEMGRAIPGKLWDGLKATWDAYVTFSRFIGEKIGGWATTAFEKIGEMGRALPGKLWDGLKATWDAYVTFSRFIGEKVAGWSATAFEKMGEMGRALPGKLWDGLKGVWDAVVTLGTFVTGKIGDAGHAILAGARNLGATIVSGIKNKIWETIESSINLAGKMSDVYHSALAWVQLNFKALGTWIIDGIVRGIGGAAYQVKDKLLTMASDAWEATKRFFRVGSPSRLMRDTIGKPIAQGMAVGIERDGGLVTDAMLSTAQNAYDAMRALDQAELSLPVLTQNVRLNYLNTPLTSVGAGAATINGATLPGGTEGGGGQTYAPHIEVHTTAPESQDPMAMAQTLGWALRTQVP